MRQPSPTRHGHAGHTMIELVTAMSAATVLIGGLASVMFIAAQTAYTPTAAAHRLTAASAISQLEDELRHAVFIAEHTATAIEFAIADRTGDGTHERIRYEWAGSGPLEKTTNGVLSTLVENVHAFDLRYDVASVSESFDSVVHSAETLLAANDSLAGSSDYHVTFTDWLAQQIDPGTFVNAPPADATHWIPTRVQFQVKRSLSTTERLVTEVRSAADPHDSPTSVVRAASASSEVNLPGSYSWHEEQFADGPALPLHRPYCLVWSGTSSWGGWVDESAHLRTSALANSGVLESNDAGGRWSVADPREAYYRLYGVYRSPGAAQVVTRKFMRHVNVTLQTGTESHSRIDAGIALTNRPELLADYWHTDFDDDPTLLDVNGDGNDDWQLWGAVPFNVAELIEGVWQAGTGLLAQPTHDFDDVSTFVAELAGNGTAGNGATMWITADWTDTSHVSLYATVTAETDGSQTVSVKVNDDDPGYREIFQRTGLTSDLVEIKLTIFPTADLVNVAINDADQGTFAYTLNTAGGSRIAAVYPVGLVGRVGSATIRVYDTSN